ncbi:MAG TPA: gamma-glutamyltransferase family protein [Stellaceae bacterium]|nr:gamma-glutamyltransferase family protein [Stellaceae bacterium]
MPPFDYAQPYPSQRSPVLARNIVATSQPLAAQAGVRMLQAGGNAVDAALAAAIALTVVEPTANGAGSDAFAILWDGKELHGLNASGRSPAAWTPARFAGLGQMPARGWDAVTVPGAVSAWVALSRRFGRLPFADLFAPAIAYAHDGFPVSPVIAALWARIADKYAGQPGFNAAFLPQGRAPRAGETFVNRPLAQTLEEIARTEGKSFYEGRLAEAMCRHAQACGGALAMADLAEHRVEWCGTLAQEIAGLAVHEIPPNTQGIATLMALGILARLGVERYAPDSPDALHLEIEAMKLAFADVEAFVGDPAAMRVDPRALLADDYLAGRARLVDARQAGDFGAGAPRHGGTVYLAAADAAGMMVSYIQSNYEGFGSGVVVPETGISLQNRGMGFTLAKGHPNEVGPRKRPYHTIIPGFAMRGGAPAMAFGVMGGPMQAQGHLQLVVRTHLYGQNPQAASDAPRWRVVAGRQISLEAGIPDAVARALEARGHLVQREAPEASFAFGGAQLVCREGDAYVAGSDHRKDGGAVGF